MSALRLATSEVELTANGAVPVATMDTICPPAKMRLGVASPYPEGLEDCPYTP